MNALYWLAAKGVQLMQALTAESVEQHLHTARFGHPLRVVDCTDSTNTLARRWAAQGAPEGACVIADRQTAGRGRRGRTFFSPAGGVYLSLVLRPAAGTDPGFITSCAAVAASRAIERFSAFPVQIKWVNDLLIGGRKVCGILTEGELEPETGSLRYAVLGIGINVEAAVFPPELQSIATSLANEGCRVERGVLIAALLEEWEQAYAAMSSGAFLAESRRRSAVLGRTVTVLRGEERFTAAAESIDERGRLVVRTVDGIRHTLHSGEVSLKL